MFTFLNKKNTFVILLAILCISAFFRLWNLESIPPGLYPDVAINGNDAIASMKSGSFDLFYPENNGREGLFMWLIAFAFKMFGVSIWSIKIFPAVIGALTTLGLFLLIKEIFRNLKEYAESDSSFVALLSSFFLAVSFWHVNYSRLGFRAILVPFLMVFSFYFLFKGFSTKKIWPIIIAGIFFGLGFYTYISFRLAVLLLFAVLLGWAIMYLKEKLFKKYVLLSLLCLTAIFVTALPIGVYFMNHPQDFVGRANSVSIFSAKEPLLELGKSLALHLGMFNIHGDPNWRHNFANSPMLLWPVGILFLTGFFVSIRKFFIALKNKNYPLTFIIIFLLSWFLIMLLPGVLTYEGSPHSLRAIGVIPAAFIFAGIGGWRIYSWLNLKIKNKKILAVGVLLFLTGIMIAEFDKYFIRWAHLPETEGAFSKNYVDMGNYLNTLPDDIATYVIVNQSGVPVPYPNGIPMPSQTVMFMENKEYGSLRSAYLRPEDINNIKINNRTVIIPLGYDENLFNELSRMFPEGKIENKNGFWAYKVNF